MGSGNVVLLAGVSVGDVGLDAGVFGIVAGGRDVCVREVTVGVEGGEDGVLDPLHAARDNTSKSINRLIYDLLFIVYIGSIRVHNISRTISQIIVNILHMLLHDSRWAKLYKQI